MIERDFIVQFLFSGDLLLYDSNTDPWKLVHVGINPLGAVDPAISISWSLDDTRIITIHQSVSFFQLISNIVYGYFSKKVMKFHLM